MTELAALRLDPIFLITLTVGVFLLGVALQRRTGSALANPTLIAIVLVGVAMHILHIPYADYFRGTQLIHLLLGPATVALAIPMVRSLEHLRRGLLPSLAALLVGSVVGIVSAYGLVRLCGGDRALALTMLPKSVTAAISMPVAQGIGGNPSLAAVFGIAAGILVAVALPGMMRLLRIHDHAAIGLAAGTAGSGIATARVIPMGPVPAAFAGVALGMNGLLTAALAPIAARLLSHW